MKLQILKGTKDYPPKEQIIREKILDILVKNFKKYGYKPIETSILEYFDILSSKYAGGAEILKETYKLTDQGGRLLGLRYELTIKLAKMIGLNPMMRFPFKRYEIGKVFRDGPVKTGRLREFTQCDVDVVGIKSVVADAEFIAMTFDIFQDLDLKVKVLVNNRKLLNGILEYAEVPDDKRLDTILAIDKLEKIGKDGVEKELVDIGLTKDVINRIFDVFDRATGSNDEKLKYLDETIDNNIGKEGLKELREFFEFCKDFGVQQEDLIFTPSLARGLAYYTSMMWEVFLKEGKITSSLAAGGRWDKMIQNFLQSTQEYPATGMTFGLDVIYTALKEKGFEEFIKEKDLIPKVLVIPINTLNKCLEIAQALRRENISTDIAVTKKLTKALEYADKEEIPYVVIVGKQELEQGKIKLRDMRLKREQLMTLEEAIRVLSQS